MFKYAEQFIDYLSGMNVKFNVESGVDGDGNEAVARIKIPCGETYITASFFGGSNFSATMALGALAPNCPRAVVQNVIAMCNDYNNANQWVKFCVRDGSSVPGLNGALICLEEAAILEEKTAAQNAYSIVSNLIKAYTESKESFKRILNGNTNQNPNNSLKNTNEKPKNSSDKWFPVILAAVGVLFGGACIATERLIVGLTGCILGGCGIGLIIKQKKNGQLEILPAVLTGILFALAVVIYFLAA